MLSFANPVFLWGLLGLAAPVLIHLINRDLFRPLVFPSIRFILRGKLPVERKRRLRDLLLLALRMLLFAAIVTALARPQWQPDAAAAAADPGESRGELVILLDASASMSGWNSWDDAVAQARELLAQHSANPVGLVISGAGPLLVEPLTRDHARLRNHLTEAAPQLAAGNHRESLRQALRLFSGEGAPRLAILSDFQESDWSPSALPQAGPAVEIDWVRVGPDFRENAAILNARALPLADGRRQVVAEVRNFGREAAERTVTLRAGDETVSREIRLDPGASQSVSFVLEEPSASHAEVRLDPDAYPADDRFFLWLNRPPPIRALAVFPANDEPEKAEELFFLSRALTTRTETQWLHFSVNVVPPGEVTESALRDVEAVFLLGAAPYLRSGDWSRLRDHVENGGRLLVTPGKAPARQTTLLADQGLIDLGFEGVAGLDRRQSRPHSIDWVLPDSPIDLLFRDDAARGLSHVSIYQYVRLAPRDENSRVLLRTSREDPLLIERPVGSGIVMATAVPFQTSWTDLPVTTAFLPIIRELVAGDLPPDHGIVHLETGPGLTPVAARLNLPADAPALDNLDPLRPGISVVGGIPVVLNAPRSESVPRTANLTDLQTAVTGGPATAATGTGAADGPRPISLWPWLAIAALLIFILEMPLAARVRRLRQQQPATRPEATPESAVRST